MNSRFLLLYPDNEAKEREKLGVVMRKKKMEMTMTTVK